MGTCSETAGADTVSGGAGRLVRAAVDEAGALSLPAGPSLVFLLLTTVSWPPVPLTADSTRYAVCGPLGTAALRPRLGTTICGTREELVSSVLALNLAAPETHMCTQGWCRLICIKPQPSSTAMKHASF
jgi:hypothetical protein